MYIDAFDLEKTIKYDNLSCTLHMKKKKIKKSKIYLMVKLRITDVRYMLKIILEFKASEGYKSLVEKKVKTEFEY